MTTFNVKLSLKDITLERVHEILRELKTEEIITVMIGTEPEQPTTGAATTETPEPSQQPRTEVTGHGA